jgi:hypothetical protein
VELLRRRRSWKCRVSIRPQSNTMNRPSGDQKGLPVAGPLNRSQPLHSLRRDRPPKSPGCLSGSMNTIRCPSKYPDPVRDESTKSVSQLVPRGISPAPGTARCWYRPPSGCRRGGRPSEMARRRSILADTARQALALRPWERYATSGNCLLVRMRKLVAVGRVPDHPKTRRLSNVSRIGSPRPSNDIT